MDLKVLLPRVVRKAVPLFDLRRCKYLCWPRRSTPQSPLILLSILIILGYVFFTFYLPVFVIQPALFGPKLKKLFYSLPKIGNNSTSVNCSEADRQLCLFHEQILSPEDRQLLTTTTRECAKVLSRLNGTTYFLYSDSLLGWYRHNHTSIPWEDYVNFAVFSNDPNTKTAAIVRTFDRLLKRLTTGYSMTYDRNKKIIKCYGTTPANSKRIPTSLDIFWRWPYVEIQLMNVTYNSKGKITYISDPNWSDFRFPVRWILPVKQSTFEGVEVAIPSDTLNTLKHNYNIYACRTSSYDHRREEMPPAERVAARPCFDLEHFVSFTNLNFNDDGSYDQNDSQICDVGKAADDPGLCAFLPQTTQADRAILLELFNVTVQILEQLNDSTYFLYGGTLIGYWRHNKSMIPWDDDVDFALFRTNSQRKEAFYVRALTQLIRKHPDYAIIFLKSQHKFKIFGKSPKKSKLISHGEVSAWRWPFVDVQFMVTVFDENNSLVRITDPTDKSFTYPKDLVLPVQRATFESMAVRVPAKVEEVINRNYELTQCVSPYYSHRKEDSVAADRQVMRPCVKLKSLYSFTNIFDEYYDDGGS